jgi:isopentenyl diphosphate isomerase/L-lactate dehydrogenase-like FMN-dependent dehydrogenase
MKFVPEHGPSHRPGSGTAAALAQYTRIFANPLSWEDVHWIRTKTHLPIAVKGIQQPDDSRLAIDNGADMIYCTKHGGRQANSGISTLQLLPGVVKAAGSTPVMFDSGCATPPTWLSRWCWARRLSGSADPTHTPCPTEVRRVCPTS